MNRYIVVDRSAQMPSSCWGTYRRVGVVELVDPAAGVAMLSERDRNVAKVVETWERLSVGKTERCAYRQALAEATRLAERLNAEAALAEWQGSKFTRDFD